MFEYRIIRHDPRELSRRGWRLGLVVLLSCAATTLACSLVIGEAPPKKSAPSEAGARKNDTPIGAGGATSSGGTPAAGGTLGSGGASARGGASPEPDGGSASGAARDGGGASSTSSDAGHGGGDGGAPCTTDVYWYTDDDGDGFGTEVSTYACPKPAGKWATHYGDCNDRDPNVHPGQTKYFGEPYKQADNTDSFDFDCSGTEEPNPDLLLAPEDCGPLKLALCGTSSGYETNNRFGIGIFPWCGSTTVRVCVPSLLICTTTERAGEPPFSCR